MPIDILKLSFAVQVAIASGYLAYLVAYAGIRQHHTASDAILKSFVLGTPASAIITQGYKSAYTPAIAFLVPIAVGVFWRWKGMATWQAIMRKAHVSWSDDIPTAWISVTATRTDFSPSQILVELTDGRLLFCDDTRDFGDCHEGPVSFGLNGDIALYVTSERAPGGDWFPKDDVKFPGEGDLITYVPASQIKRVEMRYLSEKAAKVAAKMAGGAAAVVESVAEQSPGYMSEFVPSTGSAGMVWRRIRSRGAYLGALMRPRTRDLLVAALVASFSALASAFLRRS